MAEFTKLSQAMCSVDLADSYWTQDLPRLPVPDLCLTASRYLASLKAVLAPEYQQQQQQQQQQKHDANKTNNSTSNKRTADRLVCKMSKEQREANERQYLRTCQLVKSFLLNQGPQLQRDLKEYANKCQNWATEYWLQDMYLSNPIPLPVNSNPFFMFPRQQFATSREMLIFATRIIQFAVEFKYRIDQQALKQDFGSGHAKGKPLCMETYKNFFHSYRMPHEDMDRLLPQSRRSNHIVVASCDQFFVLRLGQDPLPDPYRKDAGSVLDGASIYEQLLRIYRVSRENARRQLTFGNGDSNNNNNNNNNNWSSISANKLHKVGLFTTENRKVWAKLHKKLAHYSANHKKNNGDLATEFMSSSSSNNNNMESLRQIEDCLFVMCLDSLVHSSPKLSIVNNHNKASVNNHNSAVNNQVDSGDEDHETDVDAANVILTGGGTARFTGNRWFDKFLQIIVGRDGVCGINIEHSASEGITVLRFLEEFLEFIRLNPVSCAAEYKSRATNDGLFNFPARDIDESNSNNNNNGTCATKKCDSKSSVPVPAEHHELAVTSGDSITSPGYVEQASPNALLKESDKITPLIWELDDKLEDALKMAEQKIDKLIDNFSLKILRFTHFGRQFIKSQRLSPDAFVQLALQLTFYKLHGCLVSTYESASLRQFRLGRVDNIRANTCEAYDWIQAMLFCSATTNDDQQSGDKWRSAELPFERAISKQVEILRYTITGSGPDNHLLALKQLAQIRYDDELPDLFTDSSYKEYNNFRLSTSQLPNESGITVGYGAVVPDGYGCSYNPCPNCIVFCISSFVDCTETSSSRFALTLSESLLEMQQLCLGRELKTAI